MRDLLGKSQLLNGRRTVAASNDTGSIRIRDRLRYRLRPFVKRRHLKDTHRTVPDDGF